MSTISSGSSGLTWTSDNSSNLAITLTSIVDNTGNTVPSTTLVKGAAKAWVIFNGSAATVTNSYNVSSITRTSTGQYTITFTNAFLNTTYCCISNGTNDNATFGSSGCYPFSTTQAKMGIWNGSAYIDTSNATVSVFSS